MNDLVLNISIGNLLIAFIPVAVVVFIIIKQNLNVKNTIYALSRMLGQLLIIGYFLTFIFESDSAWVVLAVLTIMVFAASWIALRTIEGKRLTLLLPALYAILTGGGITLIIISQGVLSLDPWYWPRYLIPIAGMIFANAMNAISLAAERFYAEINRGVDIQKSQSIAFNSSLIPIINSLFAVGLVSLPGMMTGQILSGISPLLAARYQIMVMCMIFGSAGISSFLFLHLIKSK